MTTDFKTVYNSRKKNAFAKTSYYSNIAQARFSQRSGYRDGFIFNIAGCIIATVYENRFLFRGFCYLFFFNMITMSITKTENPYLLFGFKI